VGGDVSNVLIVDDDGVSRLLLRHMLEAVGHTVTDASDVDEAISVYGPGFDLVLSDFEMPGGSGLDLLERISDLGDRPHFVLLTGHQERTEFADTRIDQVDGFLTKPVSSSELHDCIEGLLAKA